MLLEFVPAENDELFRVIFAQHHLHGLGKAQDLTRRARERDCRAIERRILEVVQRAQAPAARLAMVGMPSNTMWVVDLGDKRTLDQIEARP